MRGKREGFAGCVIAVGLLVLAPGAAGAGQGDAGGAAGSEAIKVTSGGTCQSCHLEIDEPKLHDPAVGFDHDVHNRPGLGCVACHGGDAKAEDPEDAMSPRRGYRGVPKPTEIPKLCGSCHAKSSFIKKFAPNLPTDQLAQYRTSVHGKRIAAGDTNVATCVSCHGVHGIRPVKDPRSSVYPTHVVATCAKCHADKALMAKYDIPSDIVDKYKRSVHFEELTKKNDLSAPTCNDCHGSHGATPPGVSSVSNVCGTCHVQNMELFQKSPHAKAFPEIGVGACDACHGHHEVTAPDDTKIGVGDGTFCGQCHDASDRGGETASGIRAALELATGTLERARAEVADAEKKGMLMEDAEIKLQEAHQDLIKARTEVHLASVSAVTKRSDGAVAAAKAALAEAARARKEIRYRRHGLLIALVLILIAMVTLMLKIRKIES
jgi:hypothetical protein